MLVKADGTGVWTAKGSPPKKKILETIVHYGFWELEFCEGWRTVLKFFWLGAVIVYAALVKFSYFQPLSDLKFKSKDAGRAVG